MRVCVQIRFVTALIVNSTLLLATRLRQTVSAAIHLIPWQTHTRCSTSYYYLRVCLLKRTLSILSTPRAWAYYSSLTHWTRSLRESAHNGLQLQLTCCPLRPPIRTRAPPDLKRPSKHESNWLSYRVWSSRSSTVTHTTTTTTATCSLSSDTSHQSSTAVCACAFACYCWKRCYCFSSARTQIMCSRTSGGQSCRTTRAPVSARSY